MTATKARISLADLMIFVALAAVDLSSHMSQGSFAEDNIPFVLIDFIGLAFLIAYRRLSPWVWVAIASIAGGRFAYFIATPYALFWLRGAVWQLAQWVGIGMTLRDAHRRLMDLEARMASSPPPGERIADDPSA